jgi:hypothetical protein
MATTPAPRSWSTKLGASTLFLIAAASASVGPACGARTGLPVGKPTACTAFSATADVAPLDVFLMIDSSGSMDFKTAEGISKWSAMRQALGAFLVDPASKGLGVGVAFFPILDPSVPQNCTTDGDCGKQGACEIIRACLPTATDLCETDADCVALGQAGDSCLVLGRCENDLEQHCVPALTPDCGGTLGACLGEGICNNQSSCVVSAYATPAVDFQSLPLAATAVLAAMDAREPVGATPTLPALDGAIAAAMARTAAFPGHKAIVILATDGLPTTCDPAIVKKDLQSGLPALVAAAGAGLEGGVQTFLIGVLSPDEKVAAQQNLDTIAVAGGSKTALVISTSEIVSKRLVEALGEVRRSSEACEYAIPTTSGGELPDLAGVTVRLTPPGGQPTLAPRRASAAACDPASGGYYFDKDPSGPTPPGRIILCPATCDLFGDAQDRPIEVLVVCE